MATCGYSTGAPDQGFRYVLKPGEVIPCTRCAMGGGVYPGDAEHLCVDDPDDVTMTFGNTSDDAAEVAVYFVVDIYGVGESGEFTLEWQVCSRTQPRVTRRRCLEFNP